MKNFSPKYETVHIQANVQPTSAQPAKSHSVGGCRVGDKDGSRGSHRKSRGFSHCHSLVSSMTSQRIVMTNENREQLKELLQGLQPQGSNQPYDDSALDYKDEDLPDGEEPAIKPVTSQVAIDELCRYGFDRQCSKRALESGGGKLGVTLEKLLRQIFTERYGQAAVSSDGLEGVSMEDCLVKRQEEAQVLAAIYGERFTEHVTKSVWTLTLDLSFLSQHSVPDVCRFFLKGQCRFGDRCWFKHELPDKARSRASSTDSKGPSQRGFRGDSPYEYKLEIRFPKGNLYPFQAPIVAFSTNDRSIGGAGRLSVTERLFGVALAAANNSWPVVFNLITLFEDEVVMKELLSVRQHKYSMPSSGESKGNDTGTDGRANGPNKNSLRENNKLCSEFQLKQSSKCYMSMLEQRKNLPAWKEKDHILHLLDRGQVLVVCGMTGCGKTTQIPQFILDASLSGPAHQVANIICTQPRRISAISVAQRVAQEREENLGDCVGYQIRLESVKSSATRLLYCTTEVLLRRLEVEANLRGITHIMVDEVHERTEESDFLLMVLRDLAVRKPDLKVILMSATVNAKLFSEYFNNCPTIHIPGQHFPVDHFFLEDAIEKTGYSILDDSPYMRSRKGDVHSDDEVTSLCERDFDSIPDQQLSLQELTVRHADTKKSVLETMAAMDLNKINMDLVECLLEWIVNGQHDYPPGAVLVFLPGQAQIKTLYEQLQSSRMFNKGTHRCELYQLHSSLTSEEQEQVFTRPPGGVTKIILSTNIAETSITIDDVVYVIDGGKMKERRYNASKNMESLEDTWVSQANALQRKGRAGRVTSGVCFHLFTRHCFHHQLPEQQLPEIQRVPLEQLCLRIKILELFADQTLESVFSRLIQPPPVDSLLAAKQRLQDLGALTADEILTPLGYHLACLPVDVRIGKLILFGAIFSCLDPVLTIAASLAFKSPFVCPWDKQHEAHVKKRAFAVSNSDHIALLQAYKGWCNAAKSGYRAGFAYCKENFLSWRALQEIASLKRQFAELLSNIGFIKEGLRAWTMEHMCSHGSDGVLQATGPKANLNSENIRLIIAILCAALYPNVVKVPAPLGNYIMPPKANKLYFMNKNNDRVYIHPSSVNYTVCQYDSPYMIYHEMVRTSRVFLRDCSTVSVYPLLLFGGNKVNMELHDGEYFLSLDDGWIRFPVASYQVAELVKELRWELDQLLEDKIKNPSMDLYSCPHGASILNTIVQQISTE